MTFKTGARDLLPSNFFTRSYFARKLSWLGIRARLVLMWFLSPRFKDPGIVNRGELDWESLRGRCHGGKVIQWIRDSIIKSPLLKAKSTFSLVLFPPVISPSFEHFAIPEKKPERDFKGPFRQRVSNGAPKQRCRRSLLFEPSFEFGSLPR